MPTTNAVLDATTADMLAWFKSALDAADRDADSMALIASTLVGSYRVFLQREGERANRVRAAHRRLIHEYEKAPDANPGLLSALFTVAEIYDDVPGYSEGWRP